MYLYNRFISPPFARNNRMTLAEVRTGIRFWGDCTSRVCISVIFGSESLTVYTIVTKNNYQENSQGDYLNEP